VLDPGPKDAGADQDNEFRVTSWIVTRVQKTKADPPSHTNQHEPKYLRHELDVFFRLTPKD